MFPRHWLHSNAITMTWPALSDGAYAWRMTTIKAAQRQDIEPVAGCRRHIRAAQLTLAVAATFALFSAAQSGDAATIAAPFGHLPQSAPSVLVVGGFATDDNTSTSNDTIDNSDSGQDSNPSSGDIFTQNALDQSTACGAGAAC